MSTVVVFTGFEYGTATGIGVGPFDGTTGTIGTDLTVQTGTPVVGSYVGQVANLANKNYFWNTTSLGTSKTALVVSLRFRFTTLPTSANDFHSIDVAASTDRAGFYYDPADQKVHAWITTATQASSFTISVNTWYTLQFRYDCSAAINTMDWTLNGTSQTQVTNNLGASTLARYALGNRGGSNGVVQFDDAAVSVTGTDYPLPMYQVRMVGVDTGGTTTEIGTANATVRFTANGTLDGTHNSAAILTALSEVPPLLGATSSGVAQQTAGAGNAVEIPMATYTLTGGETIAGCRLYLAGWAASALSANLGMRAWNGTAETILHGDTAATNFDNSSNGSWYAFMYSGVTDQTTLNALTVRMGYSTDVSPVVGAHAIYAEILILPGAGGTTLADVAGGGAASGETGPEAISTVLNDVAGGGAGAGGRGPESTTAAIPDPAGGGAGAGGVGAEATTVAVADPAGGGAGAGGVGTQTITTVLNDVAGGGAASGGSGPEIAGSTLQDAPGGGAGAGGVAETITTVLVDPAGGGAGAGGRGPEATTVQLNDPAGGGAASGASGPEGASVQLNDVVGGGAASGAKGPESIATVLADPAGGGAVSGGTSETATSGGGGGPVILADVAGGGAASGATIETTTSSQVVHDTMVMPLLLKALDCLETIAVADLGPTAPALYQLRPGNNFVPNADDAMDECCAGTGWVRMGTMWPTEDFPIQKVSVGNGVETDWAVQVEIGIQRCLPTQTDEPGHYGGVVTGAQWKDAVQREMDDKRVLMLAACCVRDQYVDGLGRHLGERGFLMGTITPLENSGPCGGISLLVTVRAPACDCVG